MKFRDCILSMTVAAALGTSVAAQTVSLGTNPQGSVAFGAGSAVSKVGIEEGQLKMRVVPQGGTNVVFPLVNSGEMDFGVANGTVANFAFRGVEEFSQPLENLRFVAVLFPLRAGFIVRGDSDIHSLSDLKGRVVPSQYIKQMTLVNSSDAVLSTVGLSVKDLAGVSVPDGVRGIQDLEEGKVEATWFSTNAGRTRQADAAISGGIRVLPVDDTPENDAIVAAITPGASVEIIEPGPNSPGVTAPMGTFTQPFVLVAGAQVSDEVVYQLTKTLHDNPEKLGSAFGPFSEFDPERMNVDIGVPLHPGAARYYQELGH